MYLLIYAFFIKYIHTYSNPNHFRFPIDKTTSNTFTINICFRNPKVCGEASLSFIENGITLYKGFNYNKGDNVNEKEIIVKDSLVLDQGPRNGKVYLQELEFRVWSYNYKKNAVFGLGFLDENVLLYRLTNDFSRKKIFYVDSVLNELVIGTYPDEMNVKTIKKCNIINKGNNGYQCNLDSVFYIGNDNQYKHIVIEKRVSFSPALNMIYVSSSLMDEIISTYFNKDLIKRGICEIINEEHFNYIRCDKNYNIKSDKNIHDITFIIEGISIKLTKDDLFYVLNKYNYFMIAFSDKTLMWSLGYPFINKYKIVIDLEMECIWFWPK